MKYLNYFKDRSLRIDILTIFLLLITFSTVLIIGLTYSRMTISILGFSKDLIERTSETIEEKTAYLISEAHDTTSEAGALLTDSSYFSKDNLPLIRYLLQTIKDHPNFDAMYFGRPDGSFLEIFNVATADITHFHFDAQKKLPQNTLFAIRFIDGSRSIPIEEITYLDEKFHPIASESSIEISYRPEQRPWFLGALKDPSQVFWTPVYSFAEVEKEPGITASKALFDPEEKLIAVIGIDMSLKILSRFLSSLKIGQSGKAFILNPSGEALLPQHGSFNKIDPAMALFAFKEYQAKKVSSFIFSREGIQYAALAKAFPLSLGYDWFILLIAPITDFTEGLIQTQKLVTQVSLAVLVISALLVVYFSKKISVPIVILAKETDKIRHLDFESETRVRSNIHEIKLMDDSIAAMRIAIRSFGRYIPKEIVRQLTEKGEEIAIGGEKKETTVLFSDIEGFTTIAETNEPERLMPLLSEYFDGMSKILLNNEGNIDKYIGDGIMALWGAPKAVRDQAVKACRAALVCQQFISALNTRFQNEGKPLFKTRIGIDTGETIVGNVGTSERMNYTAMGDTVNTAARLQAANKIYHTSILISERVKNKLAKDFLVRPLDIVELKGKKEKIKIYELIDESNESKNQLCSLFTEAFNAFHGGQKNKAKELFDTIHKNFPKDIPTQIYLKFFQQNT